MSKVDKFFQKMEDTYTDIMEFATLIGWACVVGGLCWFMLSTMIKEFF